MNFTFDSEKAEKKLSEAFSLAGRAIRQNAIAEMTKAGLAIENYVKLDMARGMYTGSKRGKTYKRGSTGKAKGGGMSNRFHRSSAPGQAPAVDYGRLIGSVSIVQKFHTDTLKVTVGAGGAVVNGVYIDYAKYLEYGTKNAAPRPFMLPALAAERDNFKKRVSAIIRKSLSDSIKAQLR